MLRSIVLKGEVLAASATSVCALAVHLLSALRFPNDDQFILYRYIDHIVAGHGFVYNMGEQVLGATTPLFTLVCAAAKVVLFWLPTPDVVAWVNIALLTAAAVYFYKLASLLLPRAYALFSALVFALALSPTIPEGMETPLFLLTACAFFYYLLQDRHYAASIWLSLMLLTRPDAGLIAALAAAYWLHAVGWRETLRLVALCAAVALPWLLWATWYFGSFIPQSLTTKLHSSDIYDLPALQAAKIQLADISRIYWGRIFDPDNLLLQGVFNLLPLAGLAALGAWRKLSAKTWILFATPVAYFASFAVSNPIIFPWYLSEMRPFWILLSLMGLAFVLKKLPRPAAFAALAFFLAGPLAGWAQLVLAGHEGSKTPLFEASRYIKEHKAAGDSVGLADIGIVGYVSGAHVVDFIGLVNTTSVGYYPVAPECRSGFYTIPGALIEDAHPDWLVAGQDQLDRCFVSTGRLEALYEPVYPGLWRRR